METLEYRGIQVEFIVDDPGQQMVGHFTNLDIADVGFGAYNLGYVEDAKSVIDDKLDTISRISPGGKLSWFTTDLGGNRDIKLTVRGEIVKVWTVDDPGNVDFKALISEATKIVKEAEAERLANLVK